MQHTFPHSTPITHSIQSGIASRRATCPSCGRHNRFQHAGDQQWPERIARRNGGKSSMALWTCDHCHTTVSEASLRD